MLNKTKFENNITWIFMIGLLCFALPTSVYARPFNDAYAYLDEFEDNIGLNNAESHDVSVSPAGGLIAGSATAVAVSECVQLPQPAGGTFLNWSFAQVERSGLGTVDIQTCDGQVLKSRMNMVEDIRTIASDRIRLVWNADEAGATLKSWSLHGESSGVTRIQVIPVHTDPNAGETITFKIQVGSTGAITHNSRLIFSLDAVNGLHTPNVDDGLAQDAETVYQNTVVPTRPLTFVHASTAQNGVIPETPGDGAASGSIVWNLGTLSDGSSMEVLVDLRIPQGYKNENTIKANAVLEYGVSTEYQMQKEVVSSQATVHSKPMPVDFRAWGPAEVLANGTFVDRYVIMRQHDTDVADVENVTISITAINGCAAILKGMDINSQYPYQILDDHSLNASLEQNDTIRIHFDRVSSENGVEIRTEVQAPSSCPGLDFGGVCEVIDLETQATTTTQTQTITHTVDENTVKVCRDPWTMASGVHLELGKKNRKDYGNPAFEAGDYFVQWIKGGAKHTITLDHSYKVIELPSGMTFHGLYPQSVKGLSRLYKNCGTAPEPDAPEFNHNDPTRSGWMPVEMTWDGEPFSNWSDINDPKSVIGPGCRLLEVKDQDQPTTELSVEYLMRICDGSYGCAEPRDGDKFSYPRISAYSYETTTNASGAAHRCKTWHQYSFYKGSYSHPSLQITAENNRVPAGQMMQLTVQPQNSCAASQYVNGIWAVNLFHLREFIDLNDLQADVVGNVPQTNENIQGQGCDIEQIKQSFHAPDPVRCANAASPDDPACLAWWDVPAACQPSEYCWGRGDDYRLLLNASVLNTTPSDTDIEVTAEARTHDLSRLCSDNVAPGHRESYCIDSTSIAIVGTPGLDGAKTGPALQRAGGSVVYNLGMVNYGNTPNNGWYLVDQLPKNGMNRSEFTPIYDKVFLAQGMEDIVVETSADSSCFTNPLAGTWTAMALQPTVRAGYQSETINALAPSAVCVRIRRNPNAHGDFMPGDRILAALDVTIPDDPALNGTRLFNRALVGAAAFDGITPILKVAPVETVNVRTMVSNTVAVALEKTVEFEQTRPGYVKWKLHLRNVSGNAATNISLTDDLPHDMLYAGLADPLPAGWQLVTQPETGSSGQLQLLINRLHAYDGVPELGEDEGVISFWTRLQSDVQAGASIENCATAAPSNGIGDQSCASAVVPNVSVLKEQTVIDRDAGTAGINVNPGDVFSYLITATNLLDQAVFFTVFDQLDAYVDYVAGTLTINNATATDSLFSGGLLDYQYANPVNPNESLTLRFDVQVQDIAPAGRSIENIAIVNACLNPVDPSSCQLPIPSNPVMVHVLTSETPPDPTPNPGDVPEPGTLLLVGIGLAGIGLFGRKIRRR